ncbi:bcl-2-modifying factor isoform X2 [Spea bombifrons]|uniref:bcl-2-modifying factor isoform X2 n=1 Tax=Spea bombifrons TaxID=233779 RepID=UPI002349CAB0|nr:bcl-2-modifying factor isoform X2 [Spea bombifrons]
MRGARRYRVELWSPAGERVPSSVPSCLDPLQKMEYEGFLGSEELDDDVFYPDDVGFPIQPITPPSGFTQSQSYTCLLGRFPMFPLSHCCGPGCRSTDYEDKATQTLGSSSVSSDIMLPCGVTESPQRLFYGNAGYLLHHPANSVTPGENLDYRRQEQSAERRIARRLQCIGDQFHRLHLQKGYSNLLSISDQQILHSSVTHSYWLIPQYP